MDELRDIWFFDRFAPFYDRLMVEADAEALEAGLALADRDLRRVVDVGGGTGRGVRTLDAAESVVLDASRPMLAEARENGFPALQADATEVPLGDETVDAVLIVDALHHMDPVEAVLAEAERVLRPGGVLVIREVDPSALRGRAMSAIEHVIGFHSTFFTPEELSTRLEAAGFEPAVPVDDWSYTAAGVKGAGETDGADEVGETDGADEAGETDGADEVDKTGGPEPTTEGAEP